MFQTTIVIYKPPDQTRFLEQIIPEFETLDLNDEHYVLGDFSINLLFKGKYIFDKLDKFRQFYKELSPEFCSTYSFKQLIKGPTRTTCSTSTHIDPAMGIRKKNMTTIFTFAIVKVRYGSTTTAKIFKHGNYLKQLLFCFLLLDCFYICLFIFCLCFKSYYFIDHKYII